MRERSSKKKPSIQQGQELERPFKWNEDQNGIDTNEGVPIARIKARYTEQSPLMRNMTKPCQQGRRANGSSLLNKGNRWHTKLTSNRRDQDGAIAVGEEKCKN